MSAGEPIWDFTPPKMTEDEVFSAWLSLGGGWTLSEVREACASLGRLG